MFAWTVCCSCVILYVSLQSGQAERIIGNDLLDDYDDDLDGLGTEVWTEGNSNRSGTEVPIDSNRTPSETSIYTANNSTPSGTFAWTDKNSNGPWMVVSTHNNVTRLETVVPTDNVVTRPATNMPTDNNVTPSETDIPKDVRTESSKTTESIDDRLTGISDTTRFPVTDPQDVCKNSSCPDLLILTTTVSEGVNVTLRCGSTSDTSPLWWYREATVLQQGIGEVVLYIVDSDRSQSGPYVCADERGCCIVKHHVSVYSVPPYVYHLAVMGAILAVGIPLCVFLSVRQSSRLRRFTRMFNERHGEAKQLIL